MERSRGRGGSGGSGRDNGPLPVGPAGGQTAQVPAEARRLHQGAGLEVPDQQHRPEVLPAAAGETRRGAV